ncbi:hypothetical protein Leryth_015298 [Lithospermum erythrorhizon]|nr:hypothetical protein Leryth_015298 [Lithospermum erythrorhizon]
MQSKMQIIQTTLEDAQNQMVKKKIDIFWLEKLQDLAYDMDDVFNEWNTRVHIQKRKDYGLHETFLLVLDDVWDENPGKWERLCLCLKVGDPESRILLTTRKEEVAIVMGTAPSNILKPRHISDDNCWLIMRQRAFQGKSNGKKNELENIGKKIAEKCKGLPLAAKTLGAMLISKDFAEDWREVLNSKMWELVVVENELFPHIFLSYQELPSALKRCFSILALFPKDSNIPVEQVIQIWMANGFLYPRSHVEEMVKTGEKYLDFLVSHAFLEADEWFNLTMHDIMHDYALHISGDELLYIRDHDSRSESTSEERTYCRQYPKAAIGRKKHITELKLSFSRHVTDGVVAALRPPPNIQSLRIDGFLPSWIMSSFDQLTELELFGVQNVSTLPPFWKFQYLKRLLLSDFAALEIVGREFLGLDNNPNTDISVFPELEVLRFSYCSELKGWEDLNPEEDPNCAINVMPKIKILEFESCYKFDELPRLLLRQASSLEILSIMKLQSSFDGVDGVLHLHQGDQSLRMIIKSTTKVPTSLIYPSYITMLDLYCAEPTSYLPPMGKLPYLVSLTIAGFQSLKFIGRKFLGIDDHNNDAGFVAFPKLVNLEISECDLLEGWEDLKPEDEGKIIVIPKLKYLSILNCSRFTKLPFRLLVKLLSSLKKLELHGETSDSLQGEELENGVLAALPQPPALASLSINVYKGTKLPNWLMYLNNLTRLDVLFAEKVSSLPPLGKLPSLMFLNIEDFSSLQFIENF